MARFFPQGKLPRPATDGEGVRPTSADAAEGIWDMHVEFPSAKVSGVQGVGKATGSKKGALSVEFIVEKEDREGE